jgi:hypothetical protein
MDDLVVLDASLNFVRDGAVVLFVELIFESFAKLLNALLDKFGVSA